MKIIRTEKITVAYRSVITTIPGIPGKSETECPELMKAVEAVGLSPSGPWIFLAYNLAKNGRDEFQLEFCLPITGDPEAIRKGQETISMKTLPAADCASFTWRGSIRHLFTRGYAPLLKNIKDSGLKLSGESREIYHVWNSNNSPENEIEIQFLLDN